MRYRDDFIEEGVKLFDSENFKEAAEDVYEAFVDFYEHPNTDTTAVLIRIASTQLAGNLVGHKLEKILPSNGLDLVLDSIRGQDLNHPISVEILRADRKVIKAGLGYFLGRR